MAGTATAPSPAPQALSPGSSNSVAQQYLSRWERMKSDRYLWMTQWNAVALYCCPRKGNILTKTWPGTPQTIDLYDTTAEEAGNIFAAGCVTHMCPAGEKWLRLEPKNKNAPPAVKEWYDECSDRLMAAIYDSNFYENIQEDFYDAGHFGTSLLMLDEDPKELFNFINVPVGTFAWAENSRGKVDVVGREWQWTARQAKQQWGYNALGRQQREALDSREATAQDRKFTYVHFVEPREDHGYDGVNDVAARLRPVRSCYLCVEDQQLIEEGGYYTMPLFGSRLLRSNNESYGRGPGIQKLPDVRMVNAMMRDYLILQEKMGNPQWLLGDDQVAEIDNRPNGKTYWDTTNPAGKPEMVQIKARVDMMKAMIDEQRDIIRRGYYVDMFQVLTNMEESKREKTAYEVQQMVAEKLLLFSPLFGRKTKETFTPSIARAFDIMVRRSHVDWLRGEDGLLPLPPPEMQGNAGYDVVYVSKIALAIKAAENQAFATMMTLVEQAAALDPDAADVLDVTGGVRRVARNVGTPAVLIRSEREAQQRSAARAKAQQDQMAPQQSELASRAVKNLGPEAQTAAARKIVQASGQPPGG